MISGRADLAFTPIVDAFRQNFSPEGDDPGDLGSALAILHEGRLVVDLWGGTADTEGTPWERSTLVNIYSVGKPIAAVLALDAVARGEIDLDRPTANQWAAFGQHQPDTTLRQVLSHQAGLPAVRAPLDGTDVYSWERMCASLAATPPWWEPGTAHGYHVNTFGFLAGHLPCLVSGSRYRDLLQRRICGPLELDVHCGLRSADLARVAMIDLPRGSGGPAGIDWPDVTDQQQMLKATYFNPPTISGMGVVNSSRWRRASVPSTNGHATARGVAGFYAAMLPSAPRSVIPQSLVREASSEHVCGEDLVLGRPTRFGLGFQLPQAMRQVGIGPGSYGHFGFGGSLAFADPTFDVAFCYLLNRPGDRWQNPRTRRLLDALRSCVSAPRVDG